MKIKIIEQIMLAGEAAVVGTIVELNNVEAKILIARGIAVNFIEEEVAKIEAEVIEAEKPSNAKKK